MRSESINACPKALQRDAGSCENLSWRFFTILHYVVVRYPLAAGHPSFLLQSAAELSLIFAIFLLQGALQFPDARAITPRRSPSVRVQGRQVSAQYQLRYAPLLGGSWVVISGVISRVTIHIRGLITLLITTHAPPSMLCWFCTEPRIHRPLSPGTSGVARSLAWFASSHVPCLGTTCFYFTVEWTRCTRNAVSADRARLQTCFGDPFKPNVEGLTILRSGRNRGDPQVPAGCMATWQHFCIKSPLFSQDTVHRKPRAEPPSKSWCRTPPPGPLAQSRQGTGSLGQVTLWSVLHTFKSMHHSHSHFFSQRVANAVVSHRRLEKAWRIRGNRMTLA